MQDAIDPPQKWLGVNKWGINASQTKDMVIYVFCLCVFTCVFSACNARHPTPRAWKLSHRICFSQTICSDYFPLQPLFSFQSAHMQGIDLTSTQGHMGNFASKIRWKTLPVSLI